MNLHSHIKLTPENILSPNLAEKFSKEDLTSIGNYVAEGYRKDKGSREKWEQRTEAAMDLALQMQKIKTFPWPNCSNIAFPLVTIAVLQFHSRAYPALIQGTEVVKCRVVGEDPQGKKDARARRISRHMSWQVLEEDDSWEEQHDRLLINLAVVGCCFKKSYHSSEKGHNVSEMVAAKDLVVDYFAKSIEDASCKTHIIPASRNEIREKVLRGVFCNVLEEDWYKAYGAGPPPSTQQDKADSRKGVTAPSSGDSPICTLEQHCLLDLDGDGYDEPYIITIEETTETVLRIVAAFEEQDIERTSKGDIVCIRRQQYFTKYGFIPSPDGGIYDIGFGVLLGPLNESVNSIVNQLVDAGTMANTAGGFLGRGAKIRGGSYSFNPFEWKRLDCPGEDIHKNIFPLPIRDPSAVLFQLLSFLVDYTNRISGSTDTMVGENPGQNTPAETSRVMVEQGQKIYNAIFKRVWRSMKQEFKLLYLLNALYLPMKVGFGSAGELALREDYLGSPKDIVPAADPNLTTDSQKIQQAMMVKQSAMATPGYNKDLVEVNWLRALKVEGIEQLFPGTQKLPPPPHPKVQIEQLKAKVKGDEMKMKLLEAMQKIDAERELVKAQIVKLKADALLALAQANDVEGARRLAVFEAQVDAAIKHEESLRGNFEMLMQAMESEGKHDDSKSGGVGGMENPPGN